MVVGMVILTIVLFLLLDWLIGYKEEPQTAALTEAVKAAWPPQLTEPAYVAGFQMQNEMAYHPGHAWAFAEGPARARVGMDDFAQRLIGKADRIDLPRTGDWVVQGEPAWTLHRGGRHAAMLSPVTGEVIEVNERARADASLVAQSPYADGWLIRVRTHALRANLNNLLTGEFVNKWMESLAARLRTRLNHGYALSFPDGGAAVSDIGILVHEDQWKGIVKEFFLTEA